MKNAKKQNAFKTQNELCKDIKLVLNSKISVSDKVEQIKDILIPFFFVPENAFSAKILIHVCNELSSNILDELSDGVFDNETN